MFLGWEWEAYGKIWGDTGGVDTDGKHSTTNGLRPRRQFLGRETGDCRKRGLLGRPKARVWEPVREPRARALGAEEGLQAAGVTGWCLLGVLRRLGARSWGAGAGPVLTMPGRSAYLGSAIAAARRGRGTGTRRSRGRCSGRGQAGSGSRAKAAAKGAAEEAAK